MEEEVTPTSGGEGCLVSPACRVGDTIIFKYEGNIRARVEGCEVRGGRAWLLVRAELYFEVPASQVVGAEPEG
jgi:hypothetical protein